MVNSVILTVYMENPSFTLDMELPCNISIAALEHQLLEELKVRMGALLRDVTKIHLKQGDKILKPGKSLSAYEIWDGQYLQVLAEV